MSAARTEAACLASAFAESPTAFPSHAFGYGYMAGSMRTALIQLEHGLRDCAMETMRDALAMAEQPIGQAQ